MYYEADFADGLGIRVFWTCEKSKESTVSFDTRQFPHILWNDPDDLRKQLRDRIAGAVF